MKIKLLKKIRKRFEVLYYPLGIEIIEGDFSENKYSLVDKNDSEFLFLSNTKQECLNKMLKIITRDYCKYSKKYINYINSNKPINVWYIKK